MRVGSHRTAANQVEQLGGERRWLFWKKPARQRFGRAIALDHPARVASVAIQLQPFAPVAVSHQPQPRRRLRPPQRRLNQKVIGQSTTGQLDSRQSTTTRAAIAHVASRHATSAQPTLASHPLPRRQVGDPQSLPATVTALIP